MATTKRRRPRERSSEGRPLLPPRLKDWKPGTYQIGVFVRNPKGFTVAFARNEAPKEQADALIEAVFPKGGS